ncbi:hypothetical protein LTR37_014589 [Vermiconidia calcicola]|uniref:Uncharacterized protein n=1 Tax=Vermiconidia calcicola TaxID=1690605 RepID=A0ACC3MUS9_9PEZI|nr:hypothetical protein LTR37_014589 [Vermiconidia calcicola]
MGKRKSSQACLRGEWKEVSTRSVKLPEIDSESFSTYLQWLYTNEVVVSDEDITDEHIVKARYGERLPVFQRHFAAFFKLAILADKLGNARLANAVVDRIILVARVVRLGPSACNIATVYSQLPESSPVRSLVVAYYATEVKAEFMTKHKEQFPYQFIFDLMVHSKKREEEKTSNTPSYPGERCRYHQHNEKVPNV